MVFHTSLLPFSPQVFPVTYAEGREQWRCHLQTIELPKVQTDYPYPATDDDSENLVTQTALIGDINAGKVLVIIGGTHGIEGFAGTAVQCDLMQLLASGQIALPDDTVLLLVNALNPWGYTRCHRQDHLGIDVNRNFIDFHQPLPDNPGYRQLRPLFALADPDQQLAALRQAAATLGARQYEIAFSGGQYEDSAGPFYGGTGPSHSRRVIEALMARFDLANRDLAVIDIHTGLGPYGYGEVICDHPSGNPGLAVARRWYGAACTSAEDGSSSSVPKLGLLDYAWHRVMNDRSCFITLEFGTLGTDALFRVLLDDRLPIPETAGAAAVAERRAEAMRNHFYPSDPAWREAVIFRARQVFFQALKGLAP